MEIAAYLLSAVWLIVVVLGPICLVLAVMCWIADKLAESGRLDWILDKVFGEKR